MYGVKSHRSAPSRGITAVFGTVVLIACGEAPNPINGGTITAAESEPLSADEVPLRPGRTEAEVLALETYRSVPERGWISLKGGRNVGTASGTFSGPSGVYELTVHHFIEPDGQPRYRVRINGNSIFSFTAKSGNGIEKSRATVDLANGSVIELEGRRDRGAYARVDAIELRAVDVAPTPSGAAVEAENATLSGSMAVESNHAGFSGSGFVNFPSSGGVLAWVFDAAAAGSADITFRYALGNSGRDCRLIVNGSGRTISFGSTTTWTNWSDKTLSIAMTTGSNSFELRSNGKDCANIDRISMGGGSPSPNPPNPPNPEPVARRSFQVETTGWTEAGGIITYDLDGDGDRDFLLTQPDRILAYDHGGSRMWRRNDDVAIGAATSGRSSHESVGGPGTAGAGIQAGDIDNDGVVEVLYLDTSGKLVVLSGRDGSVERTLRLPNSGGYFDQWEMAIIGNFSGSGDRDLLLQASVPTDRANYLRGKVLAAYRYSELRDREQNAARLWRRTDFKNQSHAGARLADVDGDGRDEVIGGHIVDHDGSILRDSGIGNLAFPHIDSIGIGDIDPDRSGLEVIYPQENGGNPIVLYGPGGVYFRYTGKARSTDGDKVQIGDFDPSRRGLEMWFRGKESNDQFVLDRRGNKIADYDFDSRSPRGWTNSGVDMIHAVEWSGGAKTLLAGKERHTKGDAGVFDAMSGTFVAVFDTSTSRIYVADVEGDWREEVIIVDGVNRRVEVFRNTATNPNPGRARLWGSSLYRRRKMTWNYYTP